MRFLGGLNVHSKCEALIINNLRVKEIEFLIDGNSNCKVATTS